MENKLHDFAKKVHELELAGATDHCSAKDFTRAERLEINGQLALLGSKIRFNADSGAVHANDDRGPDPCQKGYVRNSNGKCVPDVG